MKEIWSDVRELERYKKLLYETSALYQDYDPYNKYPRASRSKNWTNILGPIWNEFQFAGLVSEDSDDDKLQGDDENDSDDSSSILDNNKSREAGDGLKLYLQKNRRCFDVQRSGKGIKFNPCLRLASNGEGLLLGPPNRHSASSKTSSKTSSVILESFHIFIYYIFI